MGYLEQHDRHDLRVTCENKTGTSVDDSSRNSSPQRLWQVVQRQTLAQVNLFVCFDKPLDPAPKRLNLVGNSYGSCGQDHPSEQA